MARTIAQEIAESAEIDPERGLGRPLRGAARAKRGAAQGGARPPSVDSSQSRKLLARTLAQEIAESAEIDPGKSMRAAKRHKKAQRGERQRAALELHP